MGFFNCPSLTSPREDTMVTVLVAISAAMIALLVAGPWRSLSWRAASALLRPEGALGLSSCQGPL
jgi:hypothetical protein